MLAGTVEAGSVEKATSRGAARLEGDRTDRAAGLMTRFAERTGLTSEHPQRRYLWTDAFAVCNFLGLERARGGQGFAKLALALIERVHHTLGQHNDGHRRAGSPWLSGLEPSDGEKHPTL